MKILAIDIGSGTQDVLYFMDNVEIENCPKFILPSPAMSIARKIEALTKKRKNVYLYGHNMGGGFKFALKRHLDMGLKVACTEDAAYALSDNLEKVKGMGIEIAAEHKSGYAPIYLADFDPGFWESFLNLIGLKYPDEIMIAAQDHGFFPNSSNREGRFLIWREFLNSGGRVEDLLYTNPDKRLTRLNTILKLTGGGYVADTGGAAILGALFDQDVKTVCGRDGICIVNIGNSHTIAFLIYKDSVLGIFEHHTGMLDGNKLWLYLKRFKKGELTHDEVFLDMGHGCAYKEDFNLRDLKITHTVVIGPKRSMLQGFPVKFIAPGGDMMLTGAIGLINGYFMRKNNIANFLK